MHSRIEDSHLDPELLPTVEPTPCTEAQFVEPVLKAIQAAVADCSVIAARVFAGRIYDRKGENCTTAFGHTPNPSYSTGCDDFYLQIGIRVPSYANKPVLEAIYAVEALSNEQLLRVARARLDDAQQRTAAAQAAEATIQAEIDRLSVKKG
ncbi:hypothetical protein [Arthrobacter bambusae]|uniref:Uncharacterized protein n=1 Tax=Arthrobacter bambusae TaxID=1338426 RepID=A0AAW8DDL3_9MICC|nr:hypothetical protein [Arthrobacter bambusae]MDP9903164.1 hypothetical protein [Arthrobacter bambusae]MDQ0128842.1 hypothetical protein [Arthrobacter bambusae]MDQ0180183.1 hypothetical protein [Arthrobacter bambusae]